MEMLTKILSRRKIATGLYVSASLACIVAVVPVIVVFDSGVVVAVALPLPLLLTWYFDDVVFG